MRHMAIAASALLVMTASCTLPPSFPDDQFDKTSWASDEVPLGPLKVSSLTLSFDNGDTATITMDDGPALKGIYKSDGPIATLSGISARFSENGRATDNESQALTVTFIEAHLNGNTLFLLWRVENAIYPFTTALTRQ